MFCLFRIGEITVRIQTNKVAVAILASNINQKILRMVNFSFTLTTLLGCFDIIGALYYLSLTIGIITQGVKRSASPLKTILKVWELLVCPVTLFLAGIILFFNGWRLDPILQLQQLCFHLIVGVALTKETINLIRNYR